MSEAKGDSVASSTINYKSVASTQKINIAHDMVISDFVDWRENFDFFGPTSFPFGVPGCPKDDPNDFFVAVGISVRHIQRLAIFLMQIFTDIYLR